MKIRTLILSATGSLCCVQGVYGQALPAEEALEEVVVTATRKFRPEDSSAASKLNLPVVDTPQALTVLPSEFLRIANIDDSSGIADSTAGLQDAGLGDGTQVIINSRGFEINRERGYKLNNCES
jgi:outer membrane receptor protein involved in Fe transport